MVKRKPDLVDAHYHLGESYMRQPKPSYALAQQELEKAKALLKQQGDEADKLLTDRVTSSLVTVGDKLGKGASGR